jgi:hypothetical protein
MVAVADVPDRDEQVQRLHKELGANHVVVVEQAPAVVGVLVMSRPSAASRAANSARLSPFIRRSSRSMLIKRWGEVHALVAYALDHEERAMPRLRISTLIGGSLILCSR